MYSEKFLETIKLLKSLFFVDTLYSKRTQREVRLSTGTPRTLEHSRHLGTLPKCTLSQSYLGTWALEALYLGNSIFCL